MKKKVFMMMSIMLSMGMFCACSSDEPENGEMVINMLPKTRQIELTQEQKAFANKTTDFSFNLFRAVNQLSNDQKSSILSPISVAYVLGMLNDGAAGNTAKEITSVLGFGDGDAKAVNEFCQKLIDGAPQADPSVTLEIANAVISNKNLDVKFESQFQKDMKQYYDAEVTSLDFTKKTDALRQINGWCSNHTKGMIPEILSEKELSADALLLLMNALYFKATWTEKFDPKDTSKEIFTTESGQQKEMPMMHRKAAACYYENDVCSMLYLPYGSGDLWSMEILLPKEGKTVEDIINSLNAESWRDIRSHGKSAVIDIKIPRFETTFETDLIQPLSTLGAPSMFDPYHAEFPHISSNKKENLYVELMKQKAAIEVNEEGTKTSAVTVSEMLCGDFLISENSIFHANSPFVYVIHEFSSGVIFFIGTFQGD